MKKKIAIVLILVLFLGGAGVGGYWCFFRNNSIEDEITVGKNQSLVVAQISVINGNEITYAVAQEVDFSDMEGGQRGEGVSSEEKKNSQNDNTDTETSKEKSFGASQNMPEGEMPSGMERGNMPDGEMPNDMGRGNMPEGEMPSGGMERGNMPEGEMPNDMGRGNMSEGEMPNGIGGENIQGGEASSGMRSGKSERNNRTMYTLTGEEETALIPVGTTVTTQLGTTTTFSRLAAGDMVKLLLEKNEQGEDVIVGIWIVA